MMTRVRSLPMINIARVCGKSSFPTLEGNGYSFSFTVS